MGKRKKSARKPEGPKKKVPLPSTFACLFCNHESSITVTLNKKAGTGELSCKVCGQHFQTGINYLSAAVDVYSDWVDACDAVAKDAPGAHGEGWDQGETLRGPQEDSELEDAPAARATSEEGAALDYEAD